MRSNLIDIFCIIVLILLILGTGIFIYKSIADEEKNSLEEMVENVPKEIESENVVKEANEVDDELITKECEIDGKIYEVIAVLYIPTLEIEYPVLSSTSKELLKVSLNKYWGPNPNRVGNFCIVGHNYNTDQFFGKLHNINLGDYVQLTDMSRENFAI